MNPEINIRISRDWFDMKNALTDTEPPLALLQLEVTCFPGSVRLLEEYAEGGLFAAKRAEIQALYTFIEEMGFRGVARRDFPPVLARAGVLVLLTWLERAFLEGLIHNTPREGQKDPDPTPSLQEIIQEINIYGRNNPALLRSGGHISKALKLLKVMQEEQKKTKQILSYPENSDRKQTILSNFRKRYIDMEAGILSAYNSFKKELKEGLAKQAPPDLNRHPLQYIDRATLSKCVLHQLRSFMEVFSALAYAATQTTGLKDVHRHLLLRKIEIQDTLNKETGLISRLIKEHFEHVDTGTAAIALQNELRFALIEWMGARIPQKTDE